MKSGQEGIWVLQGLVFGSRGTMKMGPVQSCWKIPPWPLEPKAGGCEDGHAASQNWANERGWHHLRDDIVKN